jgi:hypothetical protein
MVKGVACAGSEMLQNICTVLSTCTAPQYCPVASENSVTVLFSTTGAAGLTTLVIVKAAALLLALGVGVEPGAEGAGLTPGGRGGGLLALLTVVSTPLTTASVPDGELNVVEAPELSIRGGLGGFGDGGLGGGGAGLGAASKQTSV